MRASDAVSRRVVREESAAATQEQLLALLAELRAQEAVYQDVDGRVDHCKKYWQEIRRENGDFGALK